MFLKILKKMREKEFFFRSKKGNSLIKSPQLYQGRNFLLLNWAIRGLGLGQVNITVNNRLNLLEIDAEGLTPDIVESLVRKALADAIYINHEHIVEKKEVFNLKKEVDLLDEHDYFTEIENKEDNCREVSWIKELSPLENERRRYEEVKIYLNNKNYDQNDFIEYKDFLINNFIKGEKKVITICEKK